MLQYFYNIIDSEPNNFEEIEILCVLTARYRCKAIFLTKICTKGDKVS